jgi:hypothetical protein
MPIDLEKLEREVSADADAMNQAITKAHAEIDALDPNLIPAETAKRARALHSSTEKVIIENFNTLKSKAEEAASVQHRYSPDGVRRAARFHPDDGTDATMRIAAFERLKREPNVRLLQYAEDAAQDGNVAMVEAVRLELSSRAGLSRELDSRMGQILSKLPVPPEVSAVAARIEKIVGLKKQSEAVLLSFMRSDPVKRSELQRQIKGRDHDPGPTPSTPQQRLTAARQRA